MEDRDAVAKVEEKLKILKQVCHIKFMCVFVYLFSVYDLQNLILHSFDLDCVDILLLVILHSTVSIFIYCTISNFLLFKKKNFFYIVLSWPVVD